VQSNPSAETTVPCSARRSADGFGQAAGKWLLRQTSKRQRTTSNAATGSGLILSRPGNP
jgi:hypothetical protein